MTSLEIILTIITALLSGTNILSIITIKSYKKLKKFESDNKEIDNLKMILELQKQEIDRLSERVQKLEKLACFDSDCKERK